MVFDSSISKMGQHALLDNRSVEVATGDVHATAGIDFAMMRIAKAHHSDIERAAAEVKDDSVLWFGNGLFVIQRSRDGLEFKIHFFEASFMRGLPKRLLCLVILFWRLGKLSRSSKRHGIDLLPENIFRPLF